jgi:ankyrin repeat protein
LLVAAGAPLDSQDETQFTALILVAMSGDSEIVKQLISAGASLDLEDRGGWNALIWAINKGHIEITK